MIHLQSFQLLDPGSPSCLVDFLEHFMIDIEINLTLMGDGELEGHRLVGLRHSLPASVSYGTCYI